MNPRLWVANFYEKLQRGGRYAHHTEGPEDNGAFNFVYFAATALVMGALLGLDICGAPDQTAPPLAPAIGQPGPRR